LQKKEIKSISHLTWDYRFFESFIKKYANNLQIIIYFAGKKREVNDAK